MRKTNLILLFCALIYSTNAVEKLNAQETHKGAPLDTSEQSQDNTSGENDSSIKSDRGSMDTKRLALNPALFAPNYLNQPLKHNQSEPNSSLTGVLKPFPPKGEQSQYLRRSGLYRLKRGPYLRDSSGMTPEPGAADVTMKAQIALIVDRTMSDAEASIQSVADIKAKYKIEPAFKVGFILDVLKRASQLMDRLFNVAVKHKEQWQALEQLKLYELMMRTSMSIESLTQQAFTLHASTGRIAGREAREP